MKAVATLHQNQASMFRYVDLGCSVSKLSGGGSPTDDRCADCRSGVVVQVDVKEIFNRDLPPLTDDIADQLYPGAKTLTEVRSQLQRSLSLSPLRYSRDAFVGA